MISYLINVGRLPFNISSRDDGKVRYDMFVKAYNETREHGGINGLTPSEMFLHTSGWGGGCCGCCGCGGWGGGWGGGW